MMKWDKRWFDLCDLVASWSGDYSSKIGAVIVDNRNVLLSVGWNDLPRDVVEDVQRRFRPDKYLWTEHAERNAIYNAAAKGISLLGATLYTPYTPCADCGRAIIQSGIKHVKIKMEELSPGWKESEGVTHQIFLEADIILEIV